MSVQESQKADSCIAMARKSCLMFFSRSASTLVVWHKADDKEEREVVAG